MKKMYKIIGVIAIALLFGSCIIEGVRGNGIVMTKKRPVTENFDHIVAETGLHVFITTGEEASITVKADENLHDIIITEIDNKVLKIRSKKNIFSAEKQEVYVYVRDLKGITAASGAQVVFEQPYRTASLVLRASSGALINSEVFASRVEVNVSSGANVELAGKAGNLVAEASSGGNIDAEDLEAEQCEVKASSGANIELDVLKKLRARASSGGHIKYKGNPETDLEKEVSGTIKQVK